ncbi:MAG: hypothetical protein H7Y08_09700 [Rhizobiaceae bacterium]|nr:hypothetical protein [Rhizobiaceae bacterium]
MPPSCSEWPDIARLRPAALFGLTLLPSAAEAHAFTAGQGGYALFVEGASLLFHAPELVVAVLSIGLLIGLWNVEGMPIVWPFLAAGAAVGLFLPFLVLIDASIALYGLALCLGALAALDRPYPVATMRFVSALAGLTIAYGALSLHGTAGLPAMVTFGLFAGLNVAVPMVAGAATLPRRFSTAPWPKIGLRILASWLMAITIMMLGFAVR